MKFEKYHLSSNCKIETSSLPGEKSKQLLKLQKEYESNNVFYPNQIPIALNQGHGSILEDVDNNRFIDFFCGSGVVNLGHNNQDILSDIRVQESKLIHALDFPTEVRADFVEALFNELPESLKDDVKINFCAPTGADAVEFSRKIAIAYTKRKSFISFYGAYHGMTNGALSLTSHLSYKMKLIENSNDVIFLPYSYCYRCAYKNKQENCNLECAQWVRNIFTNPCNGISKPAAIIIEPVQGEGGTIVPRKGYLDEILKIGKEFNTLVIFDEIQSGFYRCGELFSFQKLCDNVPDVILTSKGLGGVGLPISACIYKKKYDVLNHGTHLGTFRGNQLSFAAGFSALKFIKKNNVKAHINKIEKLIFTRLNSIMMKSEYIGDVRGVGLMIGIEYVTSKDTKEPFSEIVKFMMNECYKRGLLVTIGGYYDNVVRFLPSLIVTEEIVNNAIDIFETVNFIAEKKYR